MVSWTTQITNVVPVSRTKSTIYLASIMYERLVPIMESFRHSSTLLDFMNPEATRSELTTMKHAAYF